MINTRRIREGIDLIAEQSACFSWLEAEGQTAGNQLTSYDHENVLTAREGLRTLVGFSEYGRSDELERLQSGLVPLRLRLELADGGRITLHPVFASEWGRILSEWMLILHEGEISGDLMRFKICADPSCRMAFHDRSKNRSARFCGPRCADRFHAGESRKRNNGSES